MTPTACNFNADATDEDGSCTFAATGFDCNGVCLFDADGDGVCDQWEETGCQDASACNFVANATEAGSCIYALPAYDCSGNCLSDSDGDGVCDPLEVEGCADAMAINFHPAVTDGLEVCLYPEDFVSDCPSDLNGDGTIGTGDLLMLLLGYGMDCVDF
jgi:hypothetical protein